MVGAVGNTDTSGKTGTPKPDGTSGLPDVIAETTGSFGDGFHGLSGEAGASVRASLAQPDKTIHIAKTRPGCLKAGLNRIGKSACLIILNSCLVIASFDQSHSGHWQWQNKDRAV